MLITCPECTRKVSDQSSKCPQCGFPTKKMPPKPVRTVSLAKMIGWTIFITAFFLLVGSAMVGSAMKREDQNSLAGREERAPLGKAPIQKKETPASDLRTKDRDKEAEQTAAKEEALKAPVAKPADAKPAASLIEKGIFNDVKRVGGRACAWTGPKFGSLDGASRFSAIREAYDALFSWSAADDNRLFIMDASGTPYAVFDDDAISAVAAGGAAGGSSYEAASFPGGKTVHVGGYTDKNGRHVKAYERAAPGGGTSRPRK